MLTKLKNTLLKDKKILISIFKFKKYKKQIADSFTVAVSGGPVWLYQV